MNEKKKLNNKGFSLVELIFVIAIMAILVGVLAPQYMKYLDKTRRSTDVQAAQTIATAVNTALASEAALAVADKQSLTDLFTAASGATDASGDLTGGDAFQKEVAGILGKESKPKYKPDDHTYFYIEIVNSGGSKSAEIYVGKGTSTKIAQLYPEVAPAYQ